MGKTKKSSKPTPTSPEKGTVETIGSGNHLIEFEVLTLEEAAALLRVAPDALEADARARRIPALFVGGEWRFAKHTLYGSLVATRVYKSELGPPVVRDAPVREQDVPSDNGPVRITKSLSAPRTPAARPPAGVGEHYDEDPEEVIARIYAERKKSPAGG